MWILELTTDGKKFQLISGYEYSFGRIESSDIVIRNDSSVSRSHACLQVINNEENSEDIRPLLKLKDLKSKYGTTLNNDNTKISAEGIFLNSGDIINFGAFGSAAKVFYEPLKVTTSCLDKTQKKQLSEIVSKLGGHITSHWQPDSRYLVMKGIQVTTKAITAMIAQRPIVTVEFFEAWWDSVKSKKNVPNPSDYLPPIEEPSLDKERAFFHPMKSRKRIFAGKTFVCLDKKQYNKLQLPLTMAGGKVILVDPENVNLDTLTQPGTCVIDNMEEAFSQQNSDAPEASTSSSLKNVRRHLKRNGRRMIPESDIGFSVAYCSTDEYCNPEFNFGSMLLKNKLVSQTLSLQDKSIYVADTAQVDALPQSGKISIKQEPLTPSQNLSMEEISESAKEGTSLATSENRHSLFLINDVPISQSSPGRKNRLKRQKDESPTTESAKEGMVSAANENRHSLFSLNDIPTSQSSPTKNRLKRRRDESPTTSPEVLSKSCRVENDISVSVVELRESPKEAQTEQHAENIPVVVKEEVSSPDSSPREIAETPPPQDEMSFCEENDFSTREGSITKRRLIDVLSDGEEETTSAAKRNKRKDENNKAENKFVHPVIAGNTRKDHGNAGHNKNHNGFLSSAHPLLSTSNLKKEADSCHEVNCKEEDDCLPEAFMEVVNVSLVVRRSPASSQNVSLSTVAPLKNFKKFVKVRCITSSALPRIIGGRDLGIVQNGTVVDDYGEHRKGPQKERARKNAALSDVESSNKCKEQKRGLFDWDPVP